ncbi:MAG: hypothetical protein MI892_24825 [Desulfobacterales bacterium]|nr:hypothetical protein [Desulfobacterales bacterium]
MGSNLYLIINVPSFIIVAIVTLCGILFSFGPTFPFKALVGAFVIVDHFTKKDFNLSVKLFNHASYLSFVAGLIGTLISFMQIFTVSNNWQLVDTRTVIALLPFFYGVIGSILIFQSLKFSLIHNYVNKFTR